MAHLEGVLTLVSLSGPWFRVQGRHVRVTDKPVGFRLTVDHASGVTVDVHVGSGLWVRAGWYPAHQNCPHGHSVTRHRCWAARFKPRVIERGIA